MKRPQRKELTTPQAPEMVRDFARTISRLRPLAPTREPDHLDKTIYALLHHLPPPGAVWSEVDRQNWLETMHQTFRLVYRDTE